MSQQDQPANEEENRKYFDVFNDVDVKEAIGTFFLGVLTLLLFLELRQTQRRYESLLQESGKAE